MKHSIKRSIVLIAMFSVFAAAASGLAPLQNLEDGKTTMLTLTNVQQGNQLYIKDRQGNILYEEVIQGSGEFSKGFNLQMFSHGEYYFELDTDSQVHKFPFKVGKKGVKIKKEKIQQIEMMENRPAFEIGVKRNIPSFKGQNFVHYNHSKN